MSQRVITDLCWLWQYDNTHGASVDATTSLCLRYTLYSVNSTLVLHPTKHSLSTQTSTGVLRGQQAKDIQPFLSLSLPLLSPSLPPSFSLSLSFSIQGLIFINCTYI